MAHIEGHCNQDFSRDYPGLDLHVKEIDGKVVALDVKLHEWPTVYLYSHNGKPIVVHANPQPPISLGKEAEARIWIANRYPGYQGQITYPNHHARPL